MQLLQAIVFAFSVCTLALQPVRSANILFFFGLSTYSHRLIAWPLVEALLEKNHTISFFQPGTNKNPHPKVTEINPIIDGISEKVNFMQERLKLGQRWFLLSLTYQLPQISLNLCDMFLQDPKIVQWIKSSRFDLIVIDSLFNECAYGISHLHKAKTIIFGTSQPNGWMADALGFPSETHWLPELHFSFDLPLNFMSRVFSTLSILYFNVIRHSTFPKMEEILREKLNIPDMPSIPEMMANTSLMFTNTYFTEELARAHPPNVVSIGGMNCKEKSQLKPIPKDILDFINGGSDNGFILVSFGSGARISDAPEYLQNVFFKAFEKMKIRFIWKWENERPKHMPTNVMTVPWILQQEILSHPKIQGFITHGGLLSIHEAICHQVPMIVFPVFAEQDFNGERVNRTERGITLDITTITQEKLEYAINEILYSEKYRKNVAKVSKRFMDRPMKPVETAVWWTEFVLRHEDTSFMRPLAVYLSWYQRRLLDVWAFLLIVVLTIVYINFKLLKFAYKKTMHNRLGFCSQFMKVKVN